MNELLRQRILRRLDGMSDERGYQILDYVEFLESKYASRSTGDTLVSRITDTAENTMRAVGVPIKAIAGTMGLVDSAGKVMKGVAAAAQSVVEEAVKAAGAGERGTNVERGTGNAEGGAGKAERGPGAGGSGGTPA